MFARRHALSHLSLILQHSSNYITGFAMHLSMKEFMRLVKKANWFFDLAKASSIDPLIGALGGEYNELRGDDFRTPTAREITAVRCILCEMPLAKRTKYQQAINYLSNQLGIPHNLRLKVREYKNGWGAGQLRQDMQFMHCSRVQPRAVYLSSGLDPHYSREICVPLGGAIGDWDWHEFVFAFAIYDDSDAAPAQPPQAARNFGFIDNVEVSYMYRFTLQAGTPFMSQHGTLSEHRETGLPKKIPLDSLEVFSWNPRTRTITEEQF